MIRLDSDDHGTLGVMIPPQGTGWCYTLEDPPQATKIPGRTRIPAGRYELLLRREGRLHRKYTQRFGAWHRGMLWLQDVPNFTWIEVHCGVEPGDTAGCPLVGDVAVRRGDGPRLQDSVIAYKRVYPPIAGPLEGGERVWLDVREWA